jgi:hypothetical protein
VRKRILALAAFLALAVVLVPQSASATKPSHTCPPGFDLGGLTFEQALALPRVQAGIAAGAFTADQLAVEFDALDVNNDEVICFQTVPASGIPPNPVTGWQYGYNVVDDAASVPSG